MNVLIVYYSTYGNVYKMAQLVAEGVRQVPGAEPVIRTVPELIPAEVIESRQDMKAGREMQKDVPLVTMDDFRQAGAIAFGTPTRFGNVSAQLKNQIDQLTSLWLKGELEGKAGRRVHLDRQPARRAGDDDPDADGPAAAPGHDPGGRAVFGPGAVHHAGRRVALRPRPRGRPRAQREIDPQEAAICRALGRRLAQVGLRLQG